MSFINHGRRAGLGLLAGLLIISAPAAALDPTHALWGQVLRSYVSQGQVNYKGLKKKSGPLHQYLDAVSEVTEDEFSNYSVNERKALLINLYNASVVSLVLKHYPVSSIKEIGVKYIGPWKLRFIPLWGKILSLDEIEHGILRQRLFDPRIHFALVCASRGGPDLYPVPFTGALIDEQLDDAAGRYLNDDSINHVDPAEKTIALSEIFRWFADDFNRAYGSVWKTVGRFVPSAAAMPAGVTMKITYTPYDWDLNDQKKPD